jgi:hypothetical protein
LAIHFGIVDRTFENWLAEYPELAAAVNSARESLDSRVERSLAKRAIGFKGKAVKIFRDNKTGEIVNAPYTEHYPPDTEAAKFWLTNRRPDRWRNKQEIEHTGNNQPAISADEAARLIAFTFAAALQPGASRPVIELDGVATEAHAAQAKVNPFAD